MIARLLSILLLSLPVTLFAQTGITGTFNNGLGHSFEIRPDSTFHYEYNGHMMYSWANGKWSMQGDTIYFQRVMIYDTAVVYGADSVQRDSIIVSANQRSERIDSALDYSHQHGELYQDADCFPGKLCFKDDRLYVILNDGTLEKEKVYIFTFGLQGYYYTSYERVQEKKKKTKRK